MKRFILTAPTFSGEVTALYADDDTLQRISFEDASLSDEQVQWLKERLPVRYSPAFHELCNKARLTVTSEAYQITFEMFWNRYNHKVNAKRARTLWDRLSKADQAAAYAFIPRYNRHLDANPWKTKRDPDTYLRQRTWEDNLK